MGVRRKWVASLQKEQFGPWALVTGASSGIGREVAQQLAANGINVAAVARKESALNEVTNKLRKEYSVEAVSIVADLSDPNFLDDIEAGLGDREIGLIVSNAGTGVPGAFLDIPEDILLKIGHLNSLAHMRLVRRFAPALLRRGSGGVILVSAMGAELGIPMMANDGAGKSYVNSLGQALHSEWKGRGVHISVVIPGPTETPVLDKFGMRRDKLPTQPIRVDRCAYEALNAVKRNKMMHTTGWKFRLVRALTPPGLMRAMNGKMLSMGVEPGTARLGHV